MRSVATFGKWFLVARGLFQAGGLSALTAGVTLLVVTVSATGTDVSDFRSYNLGYFVGTFLTMVCYPQFSFFVLQYEVSEGDRLEMLLTSGLLVSLCMIAGGVFGMLEFSGLLGLGLISGLVLNSGLYLNTESFSLALRRQTLDRYFRVRLLAVVVPFLVWSVVTASGGSHIAALLIFEILRGFVFLISFGVAVYMVAQRNGWARPKVNAAIIRAMIGRHVIKVCEAIIVVLLPFFIMSSLNESLAPIRIGFQIGMALCGVLGIVVVPRILRAARLESVGAVVHSVSLFFTVFGGLVLYLWGRSNSPSYLPYLAGTVLALFLPALSINGAMALRMLGAGPVAVAWVLSAVASLVLQVIFVGELLPLLAGIWLVSAGYSLSLLVRARNIR